MPQQAEGLQIALGCPWAAESPAANLVDECAAIPGDRAAPFLQAPYKKQGAEGRFLLSPLSVWLIQKRVVLLRLEYF